MKAYVKSQLVLQSDPSLSNLYSYGILTKLADIVHKNNVPESRVNLCRMLEIGQRLVDRLG